MELKIEDTTFLAFANMLSCTTPLLSFVFVSSVPFKSAVSTDGWMSITVLFSIEGDRIKIREIAKDDRTRENKETRRGTYWPMIFVHIL